MKAGLKEKNALVPKKVIQRGVESGSGWLWAQLQDAAQDGRQADDYGGERIEEAVSGSISGMGQAARYLIKRQSISKDKEQDASVDGTELKNYEHGNYLRIKTKEAMQEGSETAKGNATRETTHIKERTSLARGIEKASQVTTQLPSSYERGRKLAEGRAEEIRCRNEVRMGNGTARWNRHAVSSLTATGRATRTNVGRVRPAEKTVGREQRMLGRPHQQGGDTPTPPSNAVMRQAAHAAGENKTISQMRQAVEATQATAKKTSGAAGRALRAIRNAGENLAAALIGGGGITVGIVLLVCILGLLLASAFGIFFSGEDSGTGYTMPEAVRLLNTEFTDRIEMIKENATYDILDLDNAGSSAMVANWDDVLAVYAVCTTMDKTSPEETATLTEAKLELLRGIFWEMNAISYWVETVSAGEGESDTYILHIAVAVMDHTQAAEHYCLDTEQREMLAELMKPEYQELFMRIIGSYRDISLSGSEIKEILETLPEELSEERMRVVLTAYQLLEKVGYFWGGKSLILGWDSRWGTPMEVTAAGSPTTGAMRPFGLDCSGFVDWAFYNATGGEYVIGHGGGASAQHSYCTGITWAEAQPGDLVFYPGDSHVGIVCGFDDDGNILVIHCASGSNNVVVTGKSGFCTVARPSYFH